MVGINSHIGAVNICPLEIVDAIVAVGIVADTHDAARLGSGQGARQHLPVTLCSARHLETVPHHGFTALGHLLRRKRVAAMVTAQNKSLVLFHLDYTFLH